MCFLLYLDGIEEFGGCFRVCEFFQGVCCKCENGFGYGFWFLILCWSCCVEFFEVVNCVQYQLFDYVECFVVQGWIVVVVFDVFFGFYFGVGVQVEEELSVFVLVFIESCNEVDVVCDEFVDQVVVYFFEYVECEVVSVFVFVVDCY